MPKPRRLGILTLASFAGMFVLGFIAGWAVVTNDSSPAGVITESGLRMSGQYKLVSPLLLCSSAEVGNVDQYVSLQSQVNTEIASDKQAGNVTDVSVYFRDFKGKWLDINSTAQYAPASLLKVPIMIAYLKSSESDHGILGKRLTYMGAIDENGAETFATSSDIKPGTYTVDELLKAMIVYSDNNAATLLYENMDKTWLSEVYSDLGLSLKPGGSADTENITAKQYSYFFRILYNATYLTPANSEKALELLSGPDFPQGIESTVPAGVTVANKFGERSILTPTGAVVERELHDCGIVYAPNGPYLLCIMTRGKDFGALTKVIDAISSIVYKATNSN